MRFCEFADAYNGIYDGWSFGEIALRKILLVLFIVGLYPSLAIGDSPARDLQRIRNLVGTWTATLNFVNVLDANPDTDGAGNCTTSENDLAPISLVIDIAKRKLKGELKDVLNGKGLKFIDPDGRTFLASNIGNGDGYAFTLEDFFNTSRDEPAGGRTSRHYEIYNFEQTTDGLSATFYLTRTVTYARDQRPNGTKFCRFSYISSGLKQ